MAGSHSGERTTAWLSLDPSDNQAASFWPYVIAALQTVVPGVGANSLSLLQAPQPPPIETVFATLVNELSALTNDLVLVLDDYHVIDAHDIHDGMAFLLEHLPPQIHVVITTRADPPLPLARLRARGELVEIRAADLRFTPDEAAAYLNEVMGLDLTARARLSRSRRGPKGGSPRSSWRRSRSRAETTSPASSRDSPGTTATSSTTSSRRSCTVSPRRSGASCWTPRSWTG